MTNEQNEPNDEPGYLREAVDHLVSAERLLNKALKVAPPTNSTLIGQQRLRVGEAAYTLAGFVLLRFPEGETS